MKRSAWILILVADIAYIVWGAMAAAGPDGLIGPAGVGVLPAGYQGYTGGS